MSLTLTSTAYDGRYLQLVCTQTTDVASNTSTISWTLSSIGGDDNYYSTGPTSVYINGTQVYYKGRTAWDSKQFPAARGSTGGTLKVTHDNDGSKSIDVSLSTAIYYSTVSTVSDNWKLDTIPRGATLLSATEFNDEGSPTITYNNPAGNSVSSLAAYIYAEDDKTILVGPKTLSKTGSSYTFALDASDRTKLRKASTDSNSKTVKFYIKTTLPGSVVFWSSPLDRTFSIVNSNPTASITYYDSDIKTVGLTGDRNVFVKHRSNLAYEITATAVKEATISGYRLAIGSKSNAGASGTLVDIDADSLTYTVSDSRGNTNGSPVIPLNTINYIPLTISADISISIQEETEAMVKIAFRGKYFYGNFGRYENQLNLHYRYMESNEGEYSDWIPVTSEVNIDGDSYSCECHITDLSYDKTYIIECRAEDKLDTVYTSPYTLTMKPVFDWGADGFNFNVPVSVNNVKQNHLVEQGTDGIWTYRKWSDGTAECWGIYVNESVSIKTAWGSLYESNGYTVALPEGLFLEAPQLSVTSVSNRAAMIVLHGNGSATTTQQIIAVRPDAVDSYILKVSIFARGRWKDEE